MPKVLIVSPGIKMGGAENASVNLANGLQDNGSEVIFISLFNSAHFFELNKHIIFFEPDCFNIKKLSILKTIFWLRKIIKKEDPDAVIVFQKFYSAITLLSLFGTRYRIFISERSSPFFRWSVPVTIFNNIVFTIRKPDGVIAQTSIAAEYQRKYYGRKVPVKVIPNILRDVELYPDVKRENFILAVGRLNDHLKGFDRLIEALAITKNDWPLYLAGGEEDEGKDLKHLAKKLGVENRVKFLGKVKVIDELYARAGLFVIPSRSEGFPNALMEAMSAGCCCVAFDFIAGPRDLIKDGLNGYIIQDGNIAKLAEIIDFLIEKRDLTKKIGVKAMEVRKIYSSKFITKILIDFIFNKSIYGKI